MKSVHFLAAAAALGGIAAPAAAQTAYPYAYPQQTYPQAQYPQGYPQAQYPQGYPQQYPQQYPQALPQTGYAYPGQQGYGSNSVVSQVINQLLGNRYNVTDRNAVSLCASAALNQASTRTGGYGGYNAQPYAKQAYPHRAGARVTAITNVERRNRGLRVTGLINSGVYGAYGNNGYGQGYPNGYAPGYANPAQANAVADLSFRCTVDYNGAVTNIRINRNPAWRG